MSYETEEQQLEAIKEWWKENGTPLIVGAVLGLSGFAGWKYWNNYQITYQMGASDLYNQVTETLKAENKEGVIESAAAVKQQFPDSSYAILSAFHLAKEAVEANDLDKAVTELNWVIDNHADNEMVSIAKIRLARVFIQQDKANEALPLVNIDEKSGYYGLASLVKGDALVALERKDEALTAYMSASSDMTIAARHPSLQFKIDELSAMSNTVSSPSSMSNDGESKAETETSTSSESMSDIAPEVDNVQKAEETQEVAEGTN